MLDMGFEPQIRKILAKAFSSLLLHLIALSKQIRAISSLRRPLRATLSACIYTYSYYIAVVYKS